MWPEVKTYATRGQKLDWVLGDIRRRHEGWDEGILKALIAKRLSDVKAIESRQAESAARTAEDEKERRERLPDKAAQWLYGTNVGAQYTARKFRLVNRKWRDIVAAPEASSIAKGIGRLKPDNTQLAKDANELEEHFEGLLKKDTPDFVSSMRNRLFRGEPKWGDYYRGDVVHNDCRKGDILRTQSPTSVTRSFNRATDFWGDDPARRGIFIFKDTPAWGIQTGYTVAMDSGKGEQESLVPDKWYFQVKSKDKKKKGDVEYWEIHLEYLDDEPGTPWDWMGGEIGLRG